MYIRSLVVASIAFSSCLFALSSIADEQSIGLEEVVVTARKQEESAQDIPVALTALTSELQNSSIRDLKDITGYSPNVIFEENSQRGGGGGVINIRGISPVRSDDNSLDAPIAVVVDGISPATTHNPVVTIVSHATRPAGSTSRIASRIESLTWSATLSG